MKITKKQLTNEVLDFNKKEIIEEVDNLIILSDGKFYLIKKEENVDIEDIDFKFINHSSLFIMHVHPRKGQDFNIVDIKEKNVILNLDCIKLNYDYFGVTTMADFKPSIFSNVVMKVKKENIIECEKENIIDETILNELNSCIYLEDCNFFSLKKIENKKDLFCQVVNLYDLEYLKDVFYNSNLFKDLSKEEKDEMYHESIIRRYKNGNMLIIK